MADTDKPTGKWISSKNIKHYEKKLEEAQDERRRGARLALLEEERKELFKSDN